MHGRKKVEYQRQSVEEKEALKKKVVKYKQLATLALSKRRENTNKDFSSALQLSGQILKINPDVYSLWNHRKENILGSGLCNPSTFVHQNYEEDDVFSLTSSCSTGWKEAMEGELTLTAECIKKNPKSYGAWHHRKWLLKEVQRSLGIEQSHTGNWHSTFLEILDRELKLCEQLLDADERNFHCWNYRRFVVSIHPRRTATEEFDFSTARIQKNFSNYSAFHHRTIFLPKYVEESGKDKEKSILEEELALIRQAIFTEPDDQTAWWYHQYLIRWAAGLADEEFYRKVLEEEIGNIRSLIQEGEEDGGLVYRWALLTLVFLLERWDDSDETQGELLALYRRLIDIDPDHRQRIGISVEAAWTMRKGNISTMLRKTQGPGNHPILIGLRSFHARDGIAEDTRRKENVKTSSSGTAKTLKKDMESIQTRLSRFRMDTVLPGVPKTKPLRELQVPVTKITTLDNGLRVATQETYGPLCTFGVVIDAGSRDEIPGSEDGVSHLFEAMAFKSTKNMIQGDVLASLDDLGAFPAVNASHEQLLVSIDVLRNSLPEAFRIFADVMLHPKFDPDEIEEAKMILDLNVQDMALEFMLKQGLQEAAYAGQALGRPTFATPEALGRLSAQSLESFRKRHFTARNMVLAAAGVEHEEFVRLAKIYFQNQPPEILPPGEPRHLSPRPLVSYQGGEKRIEVAETEDPLTRIAVGFEVAGWHDSDLVPMCLVQVLLGGGDSFSAGGPGKGMYSRLYRELLNRYYWVEGAEAFVSIHQETGILGISGSCQAAETPALMHELCVQICKLALQPVDPIELSRARNMLKCNILTQLESRMVLFEDLGRQLCTYGYRESPETLCRKIDEVKAEDIMRIARRAISKPVSIASVGKDLSHVPKYDAVLKWFD